MRYFSLAAILISFIFLPFSTEMEDELSVAFQNAKKGVYYGLSNMNSKRSKSDNQLVENNKLISKVKVSKEINGVKVEATGFNNSTEVSIIIYRSYETLVKDGYIHEGFGE
jgi:hypothetical protein